MLDTGRVCGGERPICVGGRAVGQIGEGASWPGCDGLGAIWEEINLEQRVWTIPAARMKMERGHRVPLSDQTMAVLEKRRALAGDKFTGLVFPSTKGGQLHRSVPKAVIQQLRGTTETAHGCQRRTDFRHPDHLKPALDRYRSSLMRFWSASAVGMFLVARAAAISTSACRA